MRINLKVTFKNRNPIDIYQDLVLRGSNTNILDCYFVDEDDYRINITGATIYFTVKDKLITESGDESIISKELSGQELTNPTHGNAEIELTPEDTQNLVGNYLYSIDIKTLDDRIYTVKEGSICFRISVKDQTQE